MSISVETTAPKVLLIVEDQVLLATELQAALEDAGYRVLELAIGHQEALRFARDVKPDLALVNIGLADRVALAGDLKGLGVPVLFISGQPDRAQSAKAVGVASLSKPHPPSDMVAAVDYLFRREKGDESSPAPRRLDMFAADALHD